MAFDADNDATKFGMTVNITMLGFQVKYRVFNAILLILVQFNLMET